MCLGSVGRVIRTWDEGGVPMAEVDFGVRIEPVCLLYQPQVTVDTPVLVHMGFVMEELDEQRAHDALALRRKIADHSLHGHVPRE
jgi:hydrogenase expression/formation protein HypC